MAWIHLLDFSKAGYLYFLDVKELINWKKNKKQTQMKVY